MSLHTSDADLSQLFDELSANDQCFFQNPLSAVHEGVYPSPSTSLAMGGKGKGKEVEGQGIGVKEWAVIVS